MLFEVCAAIATGMFSVLAIFLVLTLRSLQATLKQARSFLSHAQRDLQALSEESVVLIKNTNETISDVKNKAQSLNFLFKPLLALSGHNSKKKRNQPGLTAQIFDWASLALNVCQKVKKGR